MQKSGVKISHFQLAALLLVSTVFTYTSALPDMADHSMGRFVSLTISSVVMLLLYTLPVLSSGKNPAGALGLNSRFLKWTFGIIILLRLLYTVVLTTLQLEFRITCTAMPYLSPFFFTILLFAAALYGTLKGVQATARIAPIALAIYVFLIVMVSLSVWDKFSILRIYTPLGDDNLLKNAFINIIRNDEIFFFAVLSGFVRQDEKNNKSLAYKSVLYYLPLALIAGLWLNFLYNGVLGRLVNSVACQIYTISSFSALNIIERMDGIFITAAIIGGILKITLSFVCIRVIFAHLFPNSDFQRLPKMLTSLLVIITGTAAYFLVLSDNAWLVSNVLNICLLATLTVVSAILPAVCLLDARRKTK
jgi:hypothetical protein